jgi:hypothetical protein
MKEDGYKFLIFNKLEWQGYREGGSHFSWTDEQIDNADEDGLIGIKHGVKCYVAKNVPYWWSSKSEYNKG